VIKRGFDRDRAANLAALIVIRRHSFGREPTASPVPPTPFCLQHDAAFGRTTGCAGDRAPAHILMEPRVLRENGRKKKKNPPGGVVRSGPLINLSNSDFIVFYPHMYPHTRVSKGCTCAAFGGKVRHPSGGVRPIKDRGVHPGEPRRPVPLDRGQDRIGKAVGRGELLSRRGPLLRAIAAHAA
jgi:hypothetical protein